MNNIDSKKLIEDYLKIISWRVSENSTVTYSLGGLILGNSGAVTANYWLSEVYDKEIADAHKNADIHLHDLGMLSGYCAGWSLKQLIKEGLGGVTGKITSAPARHLMTLCNQMVNFLGIMQNEWAGAQAFSSFDTYLAPFVKADNLTYKEVKQCIQSFIFGVNTPSRWGTQSPFTNITLDWTVPEDMVNLPAIVGGKEMDFTYGDCKKEMDMVNKAFIETMIEGDAEGRGFQYPIPTYSITKDFDWSDNENNRLLFTMTAKYGTPYFSNYINSDMKPSDVRSMCPLSADTKILWYNENTERFNLSTIKSAFLSCEKYGKLKVVQGDKLIDVKVNKFDLPADYEIVLSNGIKIKTTANHLNKVLDKDYVRTDELTVGDYLPISLTAFENTQNMTYEQGKLIGAFLGDGSRDGDSGICYSLNPLTDQELISWLQETCFKMFGKHFSISITNDGGTCCNVYMYSKALRGLIDDFVEGDKAIEKAVSMKVINQSIEFRKGIIDGYLATDGSHSSSKTKDVIYTSSKKMVESIQALCASLGIPTDLKIYHNEEQKIKFGDKEYDCQNERYYLGLYQDIRKNNYGDKYKIKDGYMWFSITEINHLTNLNQGKTKNSYCLEVLDDSLEPIYMLGNGIYTHNCRLRLDLRELRKKSGGYFGSGESTGSIGVVTINMPRIAYLSTDKADFYARLDRLMDISARSLKVKRETVTKLLEAGLYPYTKHYLGSFKNHFSTIGLVGMNEACLNARWIKKDLTNKEAQEFTVEVLNHMRERLSDYQEAYGDLYNLEATPAESTAFRLAKHDKARYPDIITASKDGDTPFYTNSSHLPVGYTSDIFQALDIEDQFQTLYTSGTVFHAFLGQRLPNWESCMKLVRKIAENYKLPYYTMSPTYSICPDHGYLTGEQWKCPHCGKETEVYSRITGYYRPVKNWNAGKTQEFKQRKTYETNFDFTPQDCEACKIDDKKAEMNSSIELSDGLYLFGTKTCPNCKISKMMLDKAQISYNWIDAEDNSDLARKCDIQTAPTLIEIKANKVTNKVINASNIKGYINNIK